MTDIGVMSTKSSPSRKLQNDGSSLLNKVPKESEDGEGAGAWREVIEREEFVSLIRRLEGVLTLSKNACDSLQPSCAGGLTLVLFFYKV